LPATASSLRELRPGDSPTRFHAGMLELVGVAHMRTLRNALSFTLLDTGH
jgi:hypothetical protein